MRNRTNMPQSGFGVACLAALLLATVEGCDSRSQPDKPAVSPPKQAPRPTSPPSTSSTRAEIQQRAEQAPVVTAALATAVSKSREARDVSKETADRVRIEARLQALSAFESELNAWIAKMEAYRADPSSQPGPPQAPSFFRKEVIDTFLPKPESKPTTPDSGASTPSEGEADDEAFKAFMALAAAGICYAYPPACPFVLIFMNAIQLGGATQSNLQLLQDMETAATTGEVTPDLLERLNRKLDEFNGPRVDQHTIQAILEAQQVADGVRHGDPMLDILQQAVARNRLLQKEIRESLPKWTNDVLAAIESGTEPCAVVALLPSDDNGPYFEDENVKTLAQQSMSLIARTLAGGRGPKDVMDRYWTQILSKVGLKTDAKRVNPCQ